MTSALSELVAARFGLTGELHPLPGYVDNNFVLDGPNRYIVRISPAETAAEDLDLQNAVLSHLIGIDLGMALPEPVADNFGATVVATEVGTIRVLTWVDGTPYGELAPLSDSALSAIGTAAAAIVAALADFSHPHADRFLRWDLHHAAATIRATSPAIRDVDRCRVVDRVLEVVEEQLEPNWGSFPTQQIHGDLNELNVLVNGDRVTGVIDFGDSVRSARVAELAIAATYAMLGRDDPVAAASAVVSGFVGRVPLEAHEAAALLPLIRGRLAVSVSVAAELAESGNPHHQVSAAKAWKLLELLDVADLAAIGGRLTAAAGHLGTPRR